MHLMKKKPQQKVGERVYCKSGSLVIVWHTTDAHCSSKRWWSSLKTTAWRHCIRLTCCCFLGGDGCWGGRGYGVVVGVQFQRDEAAVMHLGAITRHARLSFSENSVAFMMFCSFDTVFPSLTMCVCACVRKGVCVCIKLLCLLSVTVTRHNIYDIKSA